MKSMQTSAMLTKTSAMKLEQQQHSKSILSPTRSLDEGFESDPDRVSTDSEQPTSGTENNSSNSNNASHPTMTNANKSQHNNQQLMHQSHYQQSQQQSPKDSNAVGSTLAQLSSAATGGLSSNTNIKTSSALKSNNQPGHEKAMAELPKTRVMGPQLIRRTVQQQQQKLENYIKDRRSCNENKNMQNITRITASPTSSPSSPNVGRHMQSSTVNGSKAAMESTKSVQRLQYQKQRQPVVASAAALQAVHNHRYAASGNHDNNNTNNNNNNNGGYRRTKTRAMSPSVLRQGGNAGGNANAFNLIFMPRGSAIRSQSVDAITSRQQRHLNAADPCNALILKHQGNINASNNATRMQHYKYPGIATHSLLPPGAVNSHALLVQPISSATLAASSVALTPPLTVLNASNIGDATATLVAAAGGSPVIASSTNSLYTFYPAEGKLQVWQSKCGDLAYNSSRNIQTQKAPVCWTQSIPRQTRRYVKPSTSDLPKKVRFSAFATVQVV